MMISLDVISAGTVEASLEESRRKLNYLCDIVAELVGQLNEENGLHRIRAGLDRQLEDMEQDLCLLDQFVECLKQVIPFYMRCEERTAVFAEEMLPFKGETEQIMTEVEIPDWIFQILR